MSEADEKQKSLLNPAGRSWSDADFRPRDALKQDSQDLLHRDGLGQVARLIHVCPALDGDVVGEELERN